MYWNELSSAISSIAFVTGCIRCMRSKIVSRIRAGMNPLNDKAEMRKAKIMIVASSDFVYTSKSLLWPDDIILAAVDLDLMQSESMAKRVLRQTEMNPITIIFTGMNDHLRSRGFLSRLREPTTAEGAVSPSIKDILESMGEVIDTLKEVIGAFTKIKPRAVSRLCSRKGSMM